MSVLSCLSRSETTCEGGVYTPSQQRAPRVLSALRRMALSSTVCPRRVSQAWCLSPLFEQLRCLCSFLLVMKTQYSAVVVYWQLSWSGFRRHGTAHSILFLSGLKKSILSSTMCGDGVPYYFTSGPQIAGKDINRQYHHSSRREKKSCTRSSHPYPLLGELRAGLALCGTGKLTSPCGLL